MKLMSKPCQDGQGDIIWVELEKGDSLWLDIPKESQEFTVQQQDDKLIIFKNDHP